MDRTQDTYCASCGGLGHYASQCPKRFGEPAKKKSRKKLVIEKPEEVEVPGVCPECGTNLRAKSKRAEYMRRYMARKRAEGRK